MRVAGFGKPVFAKASTVQIAMMCRLIAKMDTSLACNNLGKSFKVCILGMLLMTA